MHMMILRMLTTSSLSAVSSSISPSAHGHTGPVHRTRAPSATGNGEPVFTPTPSREPGANGTGGHGSGMPPPSRTLPRGSVLDLSV